MKGLAYRKLSRTSSHRGALLRNLVTSLIQHERISTTHAKAKEAQRMAERIITKAKRSIFEERVQQHVRARDYIYSRNTTMPRLEALARRFEHRPGGYTRLHLHGNRMGDNAPRALLEFVDTPGGDFKLEMTAMAIGRETFLRASRGGPKVIEEEIGSMGSRPVEADERLNELTRVNAEKVLKFRGQEGRDILRQKAKEHFYRLMATEQVEGHRRPDTAKWDSIKDNAPRGDGGVRTMPMKGGRRLAGMRRDFWQEGAPEPVPTKPGRKNSVIRIGKGAFARRQNRRVRMPVLSNQPARAQRTEAPAPAQ